MTATKKPTKKKEEVVEGEIVLREAPEQRIIDIKEVLQPSMNSAQLRVVTSRTPNWAIKTRQGRGGKAFKYVPHGYVTDTLNKAFGFDWDLIIEPMSDGKMYELIYEEIPITDKKGNVVDKKVDRHIAVCGKLVVRVHGKGGSVVSTITKSGFGSQLWLPTMEFGDALKAARSDLVKTCAFQLGIALDLYWNERAELDEYVQIERRKSEANAISEMLSSTPTTPVLLLSRVMTDYEYDGMKVAEICGTTIDLIMSANPKQIGEYWEMVKKYAEDNSA